jgi:8-oxo-dGTP diphosphatase
MTKVILERKKMFPSFIDYLKDKWDKNGGPYVATDLLLKYKYKNKEGIVLIERKFPPYGIAVPGGIAERVIFPANVIKEGREETGLKKIKLLDPVYRPFCVLSDIDQDPRAFISVIVYRVEGFGELKPDKHEDAKRAVLYTLDEIVDMLELPVLDGKEDSNKGWAFPHHKTELALYIMQSGHKLNARRQKIVKNVYDSYIQSQNKQIRDVELALARRFAD